jgi:hypothetical protein
MFVKWTPGGREPFPFEVRTITKQDWAGAGFPDAEEVIWNAGNGHLVAQSAFTDEQWPLIAADPDMRLVGRSGQPADSSDDAKPVSEYADMTAEDMRTELDSRELDRTGKKAELLARLEEDDLARLATPEQTDQVTEDASSGSSAPPGVMDGPSSAPGTVGGSTATSGGSTGGPGGSTATTG